MNYSEMHSGDSTEENEENDKDRDYVVVTSTSMHRKRYVMHKDDLENVLFDNVKNAAVVAVSMNKFQVLFEQRVGVGQHFVDTIELNEDELLDLFEKEIVSDKHKNKSLKTNKEKIEFIRSLMV